MGDLEELQVSDDSMDSMEEQEIKYVSAKDFIKPPCYEKIKETINAVHEEVLSGKKYSSVEAQEWSDTIVKKVNERCQELRINHYKHIAHVILIELKDSGANTAMNYFWDKETDGYISDTFINDTIMCITIVFTIIYIGYEQCVI